MTSRAHKDSPRLVCTVRPFARQRRSPAFLVRPWGKVYFIAMDDSGEHVDRRGTPPGAGTHVPAQGGRIGNPPHEPTPATREQVRLYAKIASQETIAAVMGVSVDTLQRHYREELDVGQAEAIVTVGGKLLDKCLKGDGPSIRFYLATRGKGAYSRKIEVEANIGDQPGSKSEEATEALIELLNRLASDKKKTLLGAVLGDEIGSSDEEGGEGGGA